MYFFSAHVGNVFKAEQQDHSSQTSMAVTPLKTIQAQSRVTRVQWRSMKRPTFSLEGYFFFFYLFLYKRVERWCSGHLTAKKSFQKQLLLFGSFFYLTLIQHRFSVTQTKFKAFYHLFGPCMVKHYPATVIYLDSAFVQCSVMSDC